MHTGSGAHGFYSVTAGGVSNADQERIWRFTTVSSGAGVGTTPKTI